MFGIEHVVFLHCRVHFVTDWCCGEQECRKGKEVDKLRDEMREARAQASSLGQRLEGTAHTLEDSARSRADSEAKTASLRGEVMRLQEVVTSLEEQLGRERAASGSAVERRRR